MREDTPEFSDAIDKWIEDSNYCVKEVTYICPICEGTWEVQMECEYNDCWAMSDVDTLCPSCLAAGIEQEGHPY